jgi:hypothetical protein
MEIAALEDKSRILLMLTFGHSNLMQTQFFWIPDSKTYQPTKCL